MKKETIKIVGIALFMLLMGLGGGYFFAIQQQKAITPAHVVHEHTTSSSTETAAAEEVWVCSMHPQIRQNEFGICPICEMDLTPLDANTSNDPLVLQMNEESVKLANIQTNIIGYNPDTKIVNSIPLSGRIQADERLASSQVTHVPGRIEKLYVTFTGEAVQVGQKLADIYAPELIAAQRELIEALKLYNLNPKLLDAARNKLRFWKIGDSVIESIEQTREIRETFGIYAQESGIVTNRRVAVGDYLKQGEPLFDLMQLNKVWVLFDAYEDDLPNISVGDRIEFTTASVPNKVFKTKVSFIDPLLNSSTRVAAVRAEINNSNRLLKPEMFVEGVLQKRVRANAKTSLSIPKSAVLWTGKRSVVYVKVPNMEIPSFQFRAIELGESSGNAYQVISGLEEGEEIVTYGSFTIDAAAQLNNQSSMMNKNVALKKEKSDAVPNFQAATPFAFKQQLNAVVNAYIQLKDAFVQTNPTIAATAAEQVLATLEKIKMDGLVGEAQEYWMQQLNILQAHSQKVSELKDVEEQRKQFAFVSDALIDSILAFGTEGTALYVQHCPMAFDNEGGDWLALEESIRNPYFGDKMMKCGLVKKVID